MIEKIKNIKLSKKQQMIIILFCIYLMMLILNILTPILADDYSYSLNVDDSKIDNIMDVLNYQWWHYFNWGGRTVAHTIAQVFLLLPKIIFNIINPLVYVGIIYLIYQQAKGKTQEDKPEILLLIHLALWFLLPTYGQTCIWLIGSCNYLWTTVIILFFVSRFRNFEQQKDSIIKIIAMFLLGVIAGWTNENTSFGMLVIICGFLFVQKKSKQKIHKWEISGLIGAILGFLILILAPGNFERAEKLSDRTFIVIKLLKRIVTYTINMTEYTMPILILGVILITIYIYNKKKISLQTYIYMIAGFLTIYAMLLSPSFPERAWTGVIVFWIIACAQLIYKLESIDKIFKVIIIDSTIILAMFYIEPVITTGKEVLNLRRVWNYRIDYIESEKSKGNKNIELASYYSSDKHSPNYGLADIGSETTGWPNDAIADYFKIDSIKSTDG